MRTGRDVGVIDLQTQSCIRKSAFPGEFYPVKDNAEFARARPEAIRRGVIIAAHDIYVRAFLARRRRRPAEAVGGANAEGEGESEARHFFLACARHVRPEDAISSGKTTQSKRSCERRGYAEIAMRRRQDDL